MSALQVFPLFIQYIRMLCEVKKVEGPLLHVAKTLAHIIWSYSTSSIGTIPKKNDQRAITYTLMEIYKHLKFGITYSI